MSEGEPLRLEVKGGVGRITLTRPQSGNTIDVAMARALMEAALAVDEDDEVRAVVLTGEGKLFCGGGDVQTFASAGDSVPARIKEITGPLGVAVARLARMNKPLLTLINGPAAGAGLSLAVLGDIALAARTAHFTMAYTAIGLTPDGGASWLLPRLVGLRRAQELVLTNRRLSADEAAEWGLITRVVDDLAGEGARVAAQLAVGATSALGSARRLLLSSFDTSLETQMELEARSISDHARTPHGREGIAAFLAKRAPVF
ncbi:MAG: enoyl-CoA hydratase [Alphaproteobacteria bacterium]|nr:enoyl-CoA hydratase [Alphaproteobacteria bacterium]